MQFVNATEGGVLGTTYFDPERLIKTRRLIRRLKYKFGKLWNEYRWPTTEDAEENGFQGKRMEAMEYMSLNEAIDKYCLETTPISR